MIAAPLCQLRFYAHRKSLKCGNVLNNLIKTCVTVEGESISRKAEFFSLVQVNPSSANSRPEGHLHAALRPGPSTHRCEQRVFSQGFSALIWSSE